jgi:predicted nucleotide-binding protein
MTVERQGETWSFDDSSEFLAEIRGLEPGNQGRAYVWLNWNLRYTMTIEITTGYDPSTTVAVQAATRSQVQEIFEVFEAAAPACTVPFPEVPEWQQTDLKPVVFIGHGHSTEWRDLKDHLADKHGIDVEAYETGSRSGHAVRDVLAQMMNRASLAVLVMTGEDETGEGGIRARQNVVHEAGLFQGRLGFERAIVLVEEGVEVFSNLDGVDQIRFPKGAISQTYGDVLAWIRREESAGQGFQGC